MQMFCLVRNRTTTAQRKELLRIAKKNGVEFVWLGDRRQSNAGGWFQQPNIGFPPPSSVREDIVAAGLESVLGVD